MNEKDIVEGGTKEENRTSDYICFDCGREYLSDTKKEQHWAVTAHTGECGLCRKTKSVTHMRAFNYLRKQH